MYIIDSREQELFTLLSRVQSIPERRQLPIGDIWIGAEIVESGPRPLCGGIIAERKQIRDFEASVLDGRYREQKSRLLSYCKETGTNPLYIIEGPYSFTSGRLQIPALMKLVARIQYKYGIPVIHTISTQETSVLITTIHTLFNEDPASLQTIRMTENSVLSTSISTIHVDKKVNANNPLYFAVACLSQCPGVSVNMAGRITSQFKSFDDIMKATSADFAEIKGDTRKIGPVIGKRLYDILHTGFT